MTRFQTHRQKATQHLPGASLMAAALLGAAIAAIAAEATGAYATAIVRRTYIPGPGIPTLPCAIQLDFGSPEKGPDTDAWAPIGDAIADSKLIEDAEAWGWGSLGQFSVCLKIAEPADIKNVYEQLSKLMPASARAAAGPTALRLGTSK